MPFKISPFIISIFVIDITIAIGQGISILICKLPEEELYLVLIGLRSLDDDLKARRTTLLSSTI